MQRILPLAMIWISMLPGVASQLFAQQTSRVESCVKRVTAIYKPLAGHTTLKQEQQFQADLARCSSPGLSASQALCIGAARYDNTRLASLLARKKISPAQYIERNEDRNRKADHCSSDAAWRAAFARGDRDGDLVPDALDHCDGTPELTATNDEGCSTTESHTSEGPSPQDVDRFFQLHIMLPNPHCDGASVPTVPAVRRFMSVNWPTISPAKLRSEFRGVVNQPTTCPVVYEVWAEEVMRNSLDDPGHDPRPPLRIFMLLKPKDALRVDGNVFTFESVHDRLDALFHQGGRARIRAINGLGLASPWSEFVRIPGR